MSDSEEKKSLNTEQKAETPAPTEAPKEENKETKPSTSSDTAATESSSVKVESEKKTDTKTASKAKLCFPKVSALKFLQSEGSSKSAQCSNKSCLVTLCDRHSLTSRRFEESLDHIHC